MSKYGNVRTKAHGFAFDSAGEAQRYSELLLLQRVGQITDLKRQVLFPLRGANGTAVTKYRADFVYVEAGKQVVEDFKGMHTALFKLKAKLFADNYGQEIFLSGKQK